MDEDQHGTYPMSRHDFVGQCLRLGWKITSAASDHLILEASNRWQMTAWFGSGLVGLVELYDPQTDQDVRFKLTGDLPAPSDLPALMQSHSEENE